MRATALLVDFRSVVFGASRPGLNAARRAGRRYTRPAPLAGTGTTNTMQISAGQSAAMSRTAADSFEARALAFLQAEFPALAQKAETERFAQFVRFGHERALAHGFQGERHVVQYLLLMLYLGPMFDTDPQLATMKPLLDPASPMAPAWRLNVLLRAARGRPEPGSRDVH
jgi:glycerol-3-phosphate acyltransferase PlsY